LFQVTYSYSNNNYYRFGTYYYNRTNITTNNNCNPIDSTINNDNTNQPSNLYL
jgi:hypothetical protein